MKQVNILQKLLQAAVVFSTSKCKYSGKVHTQIFAPRPRATYSQAKLTAVATLEKLLQVRKFTAVDLVAQHRSLYFVSEHVMTNNFNLLTANGVKISTILKYIDMLGVRNTNEFERNLDMVKLLPFKVDDVVYFTVLPHKTLDILLNRSNILAKLDLLIRKLETTPDVITEQFVRKPCLHKISLEKMEAIIDLMKENNVSCADILNDLWVLQYSPKLVQERINIGKQNNIDPIKTWMVRCTPEILLKYIQRRSDNKQILGDNTLVQYLSRRLECSQEETKSFMSKLPALENKSMTKMKEIIDFLLAQGFQPYHIRRVPKILLHSVDTTKKRLIELEKQKMQIDSLHMLTKSQKQFMQYYQALKKSNMAKVKAI